MVLVFTLTRFQPTKKKLGIFVFTVSQWLNRQGQSCSHLGSISPTWFWFIRFFIVRWHFAPHCSETSSTWFPTRTFLRCSVPCWCWFLVLIKLCFLLFRPSWLLSENWASSWVLRKNQLRTTILNRSLLFRYFRDLSWICPPFIWWSHPSLTWCPTFIKVNLILKKI